MLSGGVGQATVLTNFNLRCPEQLVGNHAEIGSEPSCQLPSKTFSVVTGYSAGCRLVFAKKNRAQPLHGAVDPPRRSFGGLHCSSRSLLKEENKT